MPEDRDRLISRDEAAAILGDIDPESVRKTLSRLGVTEERGYWLSQVRAAQSRRRGRGRRTDLSVPPDETEEES